MLSIFKITILSSLFNHQKTLTMGLINLLDICNVLTTLIVNPYQADKFLIKYRTIFPYEHMNKYAPFIWYVINLYKLTIYKNVPIHSK